MIWKNKPNSLKRLLSSLSLIVIAIIAIFLLPGWLFTLILSGIIGISVYEFYTIIKKKGFPLYKYFGIIVSLLLPWAFFLDFNPFEYWGFALIVILCFILFLIELTRSDNSNAIVAISITLLGIIYISWTLSFILRIKFFPQGNLLLAWLILVTKSGDIGAYLIGSKKGKHNLIPRISPKKSIEGSLGGLVFSVIAASLGWFFLRDISILHIFSLGLLIGILSQVGDMAESVIKRDCQVKDSGKLLPGIGGMLDVMDSMIFTVPVFYVYVKFLIK